MKLGFGLRIGGNSKAGVPGAGDTTPPSISNLINTAGAITADFSEVATAWWAVYANGTAAQSGATVKAHGAGALLWGSMAVAAGANGPSTIDDSTLTPATTYSFQIVGEDASGNITPTASIVSYTKAAAGPTVRASASNAQFNSQTLAVSVPAGTVNGEWMEATFYLQANSTPATPSGWILVDSEIRGGGSNAGQWKYKRQASSEPGSYTFDAGALRSWSAEIMTYTGASGIAATVGKQFSTTFSPSQITSASITATANSLIHTSVALDNGSDPTTVGVPSGTTLVGQSGSGATFIGFKSVKEGPVTAGATTGRTFSGANGTTWAAMTVEILA